MANCARSNEIFWPAIGFHMIHVRYRQNILGVLDSIPGAIALLAANLALPVCSVFDRGCYLFPVVWILRPINRHEEQSLLA